MMGLMDPSNARGDHVTTKESHQDQDGHGDQIGSKPFCVICGILVPEAGVVYKRKMLVKCPRCQMSHSHV